MALINSDAQTPPRIVLVDDDEDFLVAMEAIFAADGFAVRGFADAPSALASLRAESADIVALDVRMPRMDGIEALAILRRFTDVPVLMLTAYGDDIDEAASLRLGADDYVRKPCPGRLLTARARALLRRGRSAEASAEGSGRNEPLTCGALTLDSARHRVGWDGTEVRLTVGEFALTLALARRPGRVFSREALLAIARAGRADADPRAVDSHLKRIRAKFRAVDATFAAIETLYGVGYRWRGG